MCVCVYACECVYVSAYNHVQNLTRSPHTQRVYVYPVAPLRITVHVFGFQNLFESSVERINPYFGLRRFKLYLNKVPNY